MSATIPARQDIEAMSAKASPIRTGTQKTIVALTALLLASGCDKEKFDQVAGNISQAVSGAAEDIRTGLNHGGPAVAADVAAADAAVANAIVADVEAGTMTGIVNAAANLREGPGTQHGRAGQAVAGRPLLITERQDNWYRVAFPDGRKPHAGWLRADLVQLNVNARRPRSADVVERVNLRSAPGTDSSVLGSLDKGARVEIIGARGSWLQVRSGDREGWASAEYVVADFRPTAVASTPVAPARTVEVEKKSFGASVKDSWNGRSSVDGAIGPHEARIEIAGYTAAYRGVRAQTRTGSFELAVDELDRLSDPASAASKGGVTNVAYSEDEPADSQGFKGQDKVHLAIERGTLLLEKGDLEQAVLAFEDAEQTLEVRGQRSYAGDAATEAASFVGSLFTGDGELGPYNLQPYEEILFLNFKTIGYLLQGKPEAYNVGRRAADRQNELRAEFIDLIEKAKAENKKEQKDQTDPEALSQVGAVRSWFGEIGNSYSKIGDRVPSAYVNPFGYYVVGMVNEIKSYSDPSLRDNARIAYEKALELNPDSPVIKEAAKAMDSGFARSDQKVVHLIGSIGMAPEKRVASYGLPLPRQATVMPLKFPIYKEVPDVVKTIEVRDGTGQRKLGTLSALADIEAMAIRYQKDRLPVESVKFGIGLYPRLVEKSVLSTLGAFGNAIGDWRDQSINPDMRAWLALPARFQAARLVVPANLTKVQLRSFDANGRELGRRTVELPSDTHGFAYIRAVDKVLTAQTSVASWL